MRVIQGEVAQITIGTSVKGQNGTGGLLIIYSKYIENKGQIFSNGSSGGQVTQSQAYSASGGNSGGGSINIFYKDKINNIGDILANGGSIKGKGAAKGGDGSITIGSISTGTFVKNE